VREREREREKGHGVLCVVELGSSDFLIGARMLGFGGPTWNFSLFFSFWSSLFGKINKVFVQSTWSRFPGSDLRVEAGGRLLTRECTVFCTVSLGAYAVPFEETSP
jgi:hypothetical protein